MTIRYFDLAGADPAHRFSPYCWRLKLSLAHKGVEAEAVAWRFTEKQAIAFSGQGRVPVLQAGDETLIDSWEIALWLDEKYPSPVSLIGDGQARAGAQFVKHWTEAEIHPRLLRFVVLDVWRSIDPVDQAYFRESREKLLGRPLEAVEGDREGLRPDFRKALEPARRQLADHPWLAGDAPAFADYTLFAALQWARLVTPFQFLDGDDPVSQWFDRCLDLHNGLGRGAVRAAHCG